MGILDAEHLALLCQGIRGGHGRHVPSSKIQVEVELRTTETALPDGGARWGALWDQA